MTPAGWRAVSGPGSAAPARAARVRPWREPGPDVVARSLEQGPGGVLAGDRIAPGQGVITTFRKQPLFVRNLTPKEIANILRVENSTISGVLDRMQKRGLIDRILDPNNRRSIRVKPTAAGMAIKEPVQKRIEELNDMVFKEFTPQEREEVLNLLTRIGKVCADDLKEGK